MAIDINPATLLYLEGTWTPVIAGGSTAGTQTYINQIGRYTRIGNLVTAEFVIDLSALDGATAGTISITGLPFTSATLTNMRSSVFFSAYGNITFTALYTTLTGRIASAATSIVLQQAGSAQPNAVLTNTNISSSLVITGTAIYRSA